MARFNIKSSRTVSVLLVLAIWAGIYLPGLGKMEIQGNEPKRVLPAIAMLETGNWITPELAGEQYYKKPPLINWIIATSFLIAGNQSELAARLPSAISVLCFGLLLVLMPSGWLRHEGKLISAIVFLTSVGIIDRGRLIEIDALYASITGMAVVTWLNMRSLHYSRWLMWPLVGFILGLGLLLKGPIILMFFYLAILFILYHEKKLKELLGLQHLTGIIVMLTIFISWSLTAYKVKPLNVETGKQEAMSGVWISDVLDCIIGMDKLDISGWAMNLIQALAYFLPWLLFYPCLKMKKYMDEIPEETKIMLNSLFMAIATGFILVGLMPGTRSRYFAPLLSLSAIMVGLLLSNINLKETARSIWKNILLVLSVFSFLSLAAGLVLVNMRHIAKVLDILKVRTKSPLALPESIEVCGAAAITIAILCLIYYSRRKSSETSILSALTGLLITVFIFQLSTFALPVINQFEIKRPVGIKINNSLPPKETVYLFDFGITNYQSFLYYIRPPVKYIFRDEEITDNVKYVLFNADFYRRKLHEPGIFTRKTAVLAEVTIKKNRFVLVQFIQPAPVLE